MPDRDYYLPSRRLVSQADSAIVESPEVPRSRFTGEWSHKTTFDQGYLVPFLVDEILPGDHMRYSVSAYVRLSTPLFPIFDNQRIDTFFFFCPNRLVWTHWVNMMGEQAEPDDSIAYTIPYIESENGGYEVGSIYDHMELPVAGPVAMTTYRHSALPLRMYNLIYNSWFRDQNIINSVTVETDDGPDLYTQYEMLRRAKSPDYFTTALPWPQKFTAVNLLSGQAPVIGLGQLATVSTGTNLANVRESDLGTETYPFYRSADVDTTIYRVTAATGAYPMIFADLAQATGTSVNTFRNAFLVQGLLEKDARGGTRYTELIWSHFKVRNPDFRLQRPEYIGGGQSPLNITPVAQTAPTAGATVGALGAAGTGSGQHSASYAATEHGFIIGLINIRTDLSYFQGMHKMWSRSTRLDHYFPSLAGLGEQAILRQEIYLNGNAIDDATVFGYQERWHEYRTRTSAVTGMFRPGITGTLAAWHLAQNFGSAPVLNQTFIEDNAPVQRIIAAGAAGDGQQYLADLHIVRTATRAIPTYGTPVTLGRF